MVVAAIMKRLSSTLWTAKSFQSPLRNTPNVLLGRVPKCAPVHVLRPQGIRYATSQPKSRADESGHIKVGDDEGLFFIDSMC